MGSAVLQLRLLRGRVLLACLLAAALCGTATAADDASRKPADTDLAMRPYRDGPLTAADFRCPPPNPVPQKKGVSLSAMTFTSLHYDIRYDWREAQPEKFEARLTNFEIEAQVDRRHSWTIRPTDAELLDHEQGHFDVTELNALRIQKKFNELIRAGAIVGHGNDDKAAVADLNRQIDSRVHDFIEAEDKEQDQYDIATRHGTYYKEQADERRKQIAALHEMAAPQKKSSP